MGQGQGVVEIPGGGIGTSNRGRAEIVRIHGDVRMIRRNIWAIHGLPREMDRYGFRAVETLNLRVEG